MCVRERVEESACVRDRGRECMCLGGKAQCI